MPSKGQCFVETREWKERWTSVEQTDIEESLESLIRAGTHRGIYALGRRPDSVLQS